MIRPKRLDGSDSWPEDDPQVVLVNRDFFPRPGAPDVSASRRFSTKPLNIPRRFGTKTFRHQNISTQDGWMDGWAGRSVRGCVGGWMDEHISITCIMFACLDPFRFV